MRSNRSLFPRLSATTRGGATPPGTSDRPLFHLEDEDIQIDTDNSDNIEYDNLHEPGRKAYGDVTTNGQWNPAALMFNSCYSTTSEARLSQDQCEENLRKALKNKKSCNWYSVLELGDRDGIRDTPVSELCRIVALDLFQNQEKKKKERPSRALEPSKNPAPLFDLEAAAQVDVLVYLPGSRRLHVSSLLTEGAISSWCGKPLDKCIEQCVLLVYKEIERRDYYALVYSAPETDRTNQYPKISLDVFDNISIIGVVESASPKRRSD